MKECRNSNGERLVLLLNNLLKDCGCSNPNSYAISLTDKSVVDNFSFTFLSTYRVCVVVYSGLSALFNNPLK